MHKPDSIDWQIIALLNKDGRMPSAEIARHIGGISARTISHRIEALVKHNVITIRAVVDPGRIGYGILADVFIEVEAGRVREIANIVAEFPQVSYVACAYGATDISISVRVRSNEELFEFVTETLGKIPGVRRTHTYLLGVKLKDLDTWLPDIIPSDPGSD
jgi:Lrp/AsnC family transcriptional regulator for asnA, asnC and gidA